MKLIIAGSRSTPHREATFQVIHALETIHRHIPPITCILQGGAKGIDTAAKGHLGNIYTVKNYPALWHLHGKAAGPIRNKEMAAEGEYLLAIWDGLSRGTGNMVRCMMEAGKPVFFVHPDAPWKIAGTENISWRKCCEMRGWGPGTVVEYPEENTVLRIESFVDDEVWGSRCNANENEFRGTVPLIPHWGYVKVEELSV
jgi:hypothetical protein